MRAPAQCDLKGIDLDDEPHIRELIRVFLRNEGFDVYEADDGVEALKTLESTIIDLAIIDVMMPNMDGWELCRELSSEVGRGTTFTVSLPREQIWLQPARAAKII